MESYIQISKLNDFMFCPRSLYFHGLYEKFNKKEYQETPQIEGSILHTNVDSGKYSTSKHVLSGLPVYSREYNLGGKIDIFDTKKRFLVERKALIKKMHQGYKWQLFAQYFCLIEMGYIINKLFLHSLKDNKRYEIEKPSYVEKEMFRRLITDMKAYNIIEDYSQPLKSKCEQCIYSNLCDQYVVAS